MSRPNSDASELLDTINRMVAVEDRQPSPRDKALDDIDDAMCVLMAKQHWISSDQLKEFLNDLREARKLSG